MSEVDVNSASQTAPACTVALQQVPAHTPAPTPAPVVYRAYEPHDFDAVAQICARNWVPQVEGYYDRQIFGRVMTQGALKRSQFALVAERAERVVGAAFGGFSKDGAIIINPTHDERFQELMCEARKRAKLGGPRVEEMLFTRLRMYTTSDVFISRGYTNAQAELTLMVVNPSDKHQGIGGMLFEMAREHFKEGGAQGFFTLCTGAEDISFVEHHGLTCVQTKTSLGDKRTQTTFYVYACRLA